MVGRYRVSPSELSYAKLHLYPPHGSGTSSNDPFIVTPAFHNRLGTNVFGHRGSDVLAAHQTGRVLSQLVDDGFLKRVFVPKRDSDGDLLALSFPLPEKPIVLKTLPLDKPKYTGRLAWLHARRSYPRPRFTVQSLYMDTIEWDGTQWAYILKSYWYSHFYPRGHRQPKKRDLDRLRAKIPVLTPEWDGKGYKILYEDKPYVKFGNKHGLRMDPLDEGYGRDDRHNIWRNLKNTHPMHPCPLCGVDVPYKNQRSKWAKHAAKEHKPLCDIRVVSEVMEVSVDEEGY